MGIETAVVVEAAVVEGGTSIFRLTGSRYFGTATPSSDTDYYAKDCLAVRLLLLLRGFRELQCPIQEDSDLRAVYVHAKRRIHIQLRERPDDRDVIQRTMKELEFGPLLKDKATAKKIWMLAYKLRGSQCSNS